MKRAQRVVWSDGLLITPQHLQHTDLHHEHLLNARFASQNPLSWGIVHMELDRAALRTGHVQLRELHAVMPDGTVLHSKGQDAELPPSREVGEHFSPTEQRLSVYLGLVHEREGAANYTTDDQPRPARYQVVKDHVADLTDPRHRVEIALGRRQPVLLFEDDPLADYTLIKIAEIIRDDVGTLTYSDSYIPPCLQIGASPFLMSGLRRILQYALQRHESLSEARRQNAAADIEFAAPDITRFMLLSAVNTYIPVIQHWVDTQDLPPRAIYMGLSQMAGQLCTFSSNITPTRLPQFMYTDLRATFEELMARVTALLLATVEQHYVGEALEGDGSGMYRIELTDPRWLQCTNFLLAIKTDLPEKQVAKQLPQFAKIASWDGIHAIVSAATPGVPVDVTYRPPPEIPVKAGLAYFNVTDQNSYWKEVMVTRKLAMYLPPFFDPNATSIELMGVFSGKRSNA